MRKLAPTLPGGERTVIQGCDLTSEEQVAALQETLKKEFGRVDFVIHGAAFAHRDDLSGRFVDTSRTGFAQALDVSAYTLTVAAKAAEPLMTEGGSILTLTYHRRGARHS